MSGRHYNYDKGSSRSTRDDSRTWDRQREDQDARRDRETKWPSSSSRSRSRSPRQRPSPPPPPSPPSPPLPKGSSYSPVRSHRQGRDYEEKTVKNADDWEDSDSEEEVPAPPPPPRISKISIGFSKPKAPIKMSLGGPSKSTQVMPKPSVASVFNDDDDEDGPEEMPAEARMRMRNIGRETPTSAGPNSFGKTKQGFCDAKKVFEKNLKEALDTAQKPPTMPKFPQTIYKIKGP